MMFFQEVIDNFDLADKNEVKIRACFFCRHKAAADNRFRRHISSHDVEGYRYGIAVSIHIFQDGCFFTLLWAWLSGCPCNNRNEGRYDAAAWADDSERIPPHSGQKVSNASFSCARAYVNVFFLVVAYYFLRILKFLFQYVSKPFPPLIRLPQPAVAGILIQVCPATGTKSAAVLVTQWLHRKRQH